MRDSRVSPPQSRTAVSATRTGAQTTRAARPLRRPGASSTRTSRSCPGTSSSSPNASRASASGRKAGHPRIPVSRTYPWSSWEETEAGSTVPALRASAVRPRFWRDGRRDPRTLVRSPTRTSRTHTRTSWPTAKRAPSRPAPPPGRQSDTSSASTWTRSPWGTDTVTASLVISDTHPHSLVPLCSDFGFRSWTKVASFPCRAPSPRMSSCGRGCAGGGGRREGNGCTGISWGDAAEGRRHVSAAERGARPVGALGVEQGGG